MKGEVSAVMSTVSQLDAEGKKNVVALLSIEEYKSLLGELVHTAYKVGYVDGVHEEKNKHKQTDASSIEGKK